MKPKKDGKKDELYISNNVKDVKIHKMYQDISIKK